MRKKRMKNLKQKNAEKTSKQKEEKLKLKSELWDFYEQEQIILDEIMNDTIMAYSSSKAIEMTTQQIGPTMYKGALKTFISGSILNAFVDNYMGNVNIYGENLTEDIQKSIKNKLDSKDILNKINEEKFENTLFGRIEQHHRTLDNLTFEYTMKFLNNESTFVEFSGDMNNAFNSFKNSINKLFVTEYSDGLNNSDKYFADILIEEIRDKIDKASWNENIFNKVFERAEIKQIEDIFKTVNMEHLKGQDVMMDEILTYNAILDSRTCSDCESLHGKEFRKSYEPQLPMHPNCRCFYDSKFVLTIDDQETGKKIKYLI